MGLLASIKSQSSVAGTQACGLQTCAQKCRPVADMQHADMQTYRHADMQTCTTHEGEREREREREREASTLSVHEVFVQVQEEHCLQGKAFTFFHCLDP